MTDPAKSPPALTARKLTASEQLVIASTEDFLHREGKMAHVPEQVCHICPYSAPFTSPLRSHLAKHLVKAHLGNASALEKATFLWSELHEERSYYKTFNFRRNSKQLKDFESCVFFQCKSCSSRHETYPSLREHMLTDCNDVIKCPKCQRVFRPNEVAMSPEERFALHWKRCSKQESACGKCGTVFSLQTRLRRHLKTCKGQLFSRGRRCPKSSQIVDRITSDEEQRRDAMPADNGVEIEPVDEKTSENCESDPAHVTDETHEVEEFVIKVEPADFEAEEESHTMVEEFVAC